MKTKKNIYQMFASDWRPPIYTKIKLDSTSNFLFFSTMKFSHTKKQNPPKSLSLMS